MKKTLLIIGLVVAALVLAAGVVFYLAANSQKAQDMVTSRAIPALEEALGGRVKVGATGGTLLGDLVWEDVTIIWPELELHLKKIRFRIDPLALAGRHFRISSLKADQPRAKLTLDASGRPTGPAFGPKAISRSSTGGFLSPRTALAAAEAESAPTEQRHNSNWRVSLDNIIIRDGVFEGFGQFGGPAKLGRLSGINGRGHLRLNKTWDVAAKLTGVQQLSGLAANLNLEGTFDGRRVGLEKLVLAAGPDDRSRISLTGGLDLESFSGELNYKTDLTGQDLPASLNGPDLPGPIRLTGRLSGDLNKILIRTRGVLDRAKVDGRGELEPESGRFSAEGSLKELNPAWFSRLAGQKLPKGRTSLDFSAGGRLAASELTEIKAHLQAGQTELEELADFEGAQVDLDFRHGLLTGRVDVLKLTTERTRLAELKAAGNLSEKGGRVRLDFSGLTGPGAEAGRGGATLDWSPGRLRVSDLEVSGLPGRASGSADLELDPQGAPGIKGGWARLTVAQLKPPVDQILDLLGAGVPFIKFDSIRLSGLIAADWPQGRMHLTGNKLDIDSHWGRIKADGHLNMTAAGLVQDWRADLNLRNFNPPDWLKAFLPQEYRDALATGRLVLAGGGPGAALKLKTDGLALHGPWGRVQAAGGLNLDERGELADWRIRAELSRVTLPGEITKLLPTSHPVDKVSGRLELEQDKGRPEILVQGRELHTAGKWGQVRLSGNLKLGRDGSLDSWRVSARVTDFTLPAQIAELVPTSHRATRVSGLVDIEQKSAQTPIFISSKHLSAKGDWGRLSRAQGELSIKTNGEVQAWRAQARVADFLLPDDIAELIPASHRLARVNGLISLEQKIRGQPITISGRELSARGDWGSLVQGKGRIRLKLDGEVQNWRAAAKIQNFLLPDDIAELIPASHRQARISGLINLEQPHRDRPINISGSNLAAAGDWGRITEAKGDLSLTDTGQVLSWRTKARLADFALPDDLAELVPASHRRARLSGQVDLAQAAENKPITITGQALAAAGDWGRVSGAEGGVTLTDTGQVLSWRVKARLADFALPDDLAELVPASHRRARLSGLVDLAQTAADKPIIITGQALAAAGNWGRVSGAGGKLTLSPAGQPQAWRVRAGLVDFALPSPLESLIPITHQGGRLTGRVELAQSGPEKALSLSSPDLTASGRWGRLEARGQAELSPSGRPLNWRTELKLKDFNLPQAAALLPGPLFGPESPRTVLSGQLHLASKNQALDFQFDLSGSTLLDNRAAVLKAAGRYGPSLFNLERLELDWLNVHASAKGRIEPRPNLELDLNGRDLARLAAMFQVPEVPQARRFGLHGRFQGPDWKTIAFNGGLDLAQGQWRNITVNSLTAQVDLPDVGQTWGRTQLSAKGLVIGNMDPLQVNLEAIGSASAMSGRLSASSKELGLKLDYTVNNNPGQGLKARLSGLALSFAQPQKAKETWRSTRPVVVELTRQGLGRINIDLAGPEAQRVFLKADLKNGRVGGQGKINGFNMGPLTKALGWGLVKGGRLFADLHLSGNLESPQLTLTGSVERMSVFGNQLDQVALSAILTDGILHARGRIGFQGRRMASLSAHLPLIFSLNPWRVKVDQKALEAELRLTEVPMSFFEPLTKGLRELEGSLSAQLTLDPQASGELTIKNLGFVVTANGQRVEKGRAKLVMEKNRLVLRELFAATGGGRLAARGYLGLDKNHRVDLAAELSEANLLLGPYGSSKVKGKISLSNTLTRPILRGRIKLAELDFQLPPLAAPDSKEIHLVDEEDAAPPPLAETAASLSGLDMAVIVTIGPDAPLSGGGLKARSKGEITLVKPKDGKLAITGSVQAYNGRVTRFGRNFKLQTGQLNFDGSLPPAPSLEAVITTRVDRTDISVHATGSLSEPDIEFSSQPDLGRDDILSLLLFGRKSEGLSEGESLAMEAQAISALGGPVSEVLKELFNEKITPDVLSISASAEGGLSVETGKQILPDLYVSYEVFSDPTKPNEIHLEYRLTPNVSVESNFGDEKTTGVDVFFNFDFN